jgi:hypothetical protein
MKPYDIDDEFEDFMRRVQPDLPETSVQHKESRRVFFAGVCSLYYFLMSNDFQSLPDQQALEECARIDKQLMEFKDLVGFNR